MTEAVQQVRQGIRFGSLAISNNDLLRVGVLVVAFAIISLRCYQRYSHNRELDSNPVVYLHLRSLDGYRAGTPVYIAKHLASRPKSFIIVPSTSADLNRNRTFWASAAASTDIHGFPVVVCVDPVCPLQEGEQPDSVTGLVILDRLQYIPAFAVSQSMQKRQILVLNSSMIVRESITAPQTQEDARTLLNKEVR